MTMDRFAAMKARGERIVMLTCYDYPTARVQDEAGVDIVFVGDSVGTNILGYASEREVTMEDVLHHLRAVRRGVERAYLLADLPFQSYETAEQAVGNARRLLHAGADGVKLEGGTKRAEVVRALAAANIDVCGHIGFTPQTLGSRGRVQGKTLDQSQALLRDALGLEAAGARMLVLELVTEGLAGLITERLRIPTIGIGSGPRCDGQVLVVTDVLGISPFTRRLAKRYGRHREDMAAAIGSYVREVREGHFPTSENAWPTPAEDLARL